jgi:hypothetical protein
MYVFRSLQDTNSNLQAERRRGRRRLEEARLIIELERLDRLRRLKPIFTQLESSPAFDIQKLRSDINASTSSIQEAHSEDHPSKPVDSLQSQVEVLPAPIHDVNKGKRFHRMAS